MTGRTGVGVFFVVVGVLFLLNNLNIIDIPPIGRLLWPSVIIFFGVSMLRRGAIRGSRYSSFGGTPVDPNSSMNITTVMGAVERKSSSKEFAGGHITALMGGVKADFRDAEIGDAEASLDVLVVMGSIEIYVPPDWSVESHVTPLLGGYEDKTTRPKDGAKRLIIHGTVMMGGIEVKN